MPWRSLRPGARPISARLPAARPAREENGWLLSDQPCSSRFSRSAGGARISSSSIFRRLSLRKARVWTSRIPDECVLIQ